MSSLRLALKQSLQETGGPPVPAVTASGGAVGGEDPPPHESPSQASVASTGMQQQQPPFPQQPPAFPADPLSQQPSQPADPQPAPPPVVPRKRGRPRKHRPVEDHPPQEEDPVTAATTATAAHSDEEEELEEEDAEVMDDEEEEEEEDERHAAAHKIQSQWKKSKHKDSGDDEEEEDDPKNRQKPAPPNLATTTTDPQHPPLLSETSPTAPEEEEEGEEKTKRNKQKDSSSSSAQAKTVQAPEPAILEWSRQLPLKKARAAVTSGLRVKVRFATKVRHAGKVVRKKRWFGGRISAVSAAGSKIRIKYDDGTAEVTKFPDKDVVVCHVKNGVHAVDAHFFVPPLDNDEQQAFSTAAESRPAEETAKPAAVEPKMQASVEKSHAGERMIVESTTASARDTPKEEEEEEEHLSETAVVTGKETAKAAAVPVVSSLTKVVEAKVPSATPSAAAAAASIEAEPVQSQETTVEPVKRTEPIKLDSQGEVPPIKAESSEQELVPVAEPQQQQALEKEEEEQQVAEKPVLAIPAPKKRGRPPKHRKLEAVVEDDKPKKSLTIRIPGRKEGDKIKSPRPKKTVDTAIRSTEDPPLRKKNKRPLEDETLEQQQQSKRLHIHISKSNLDETGGDRAELPKKPKRKQQRLEDAAPLDESMQSNHEMAMEEMEEPMRGPHIRSIRPEDLDNPEGGADGMTPRGRPKRKEEEAPAIMRSGRRAAHKANERIAAKEELVIQEGASAKKGGKRGRKRKDGPPGEESESSEDDSQKWVQCDACAKWRIIPSAVVANLPNQWYCADNVYDPKRASCEAPEQTAKQVAKEKRKLKKKQQRLLAAAAAVGEDDEGKDRLEQMLPKEQQRQERARSPRPDDKRSSPVDQLPETAESFKPEKRSSSASVKKGGKSSSETEAPSLEEAPEVRAKPRGRPRRTVVHKENAAPTAGGGTAPTNDEADNLEWVQCEKCDKWRKLPPHVSADELPEVWVCKMNNWNPNSASCDAPEDKADGLQDVGIFGQSGSLNTGKLSYRNLIFGSTGRKPNRPVSERARAAESIFGMPLEDEDATPTVMYASSSAFVCRSKSNPPPSESEDVGSILDLMSRSNLWAELRRASDPPQTSSLSLQSYTYEKLPDEIKKPMKDLCLYALGNGTLSGDDVLLRSQCGSDLPPGSEKASEFCTINVVVTTLCQLVREGVVECVQRKGPEWVAQDWNPRYRRCIRAVSPSTDGGTNHKESRCMKISKPWKRARIE